MTSRPALIIDLSGVLMLPQPPLPSYLLDQGFAHAEPTEKWSAILKALETGQIQPVQQPHVQEGISELVERYALSCFADAPSPFTKLCLRALPVSEYFRDNLIIPVARLDRKGKSSAASWQAAVKYVRAQGYKPVACIDDEPPAIQAVLKAQTGMRIYAQCSAPAEEWSSQVIPVKNLEQMADHLLAHPLHEHTKAR
jgi:hypothetical protein